MAHPNEEMLRAAYAAFARGDLDGYLDYCTADITFHVPGRSPVAGTFTRGQFHDPFIRTVMERSGGTFRETLIDVLAGDDHGVVLLLHELEREGQPQRYSTAHVYRIREGKLASFEEYPQDLYAFDEAWGAP